MKNPLLNISLRYLIPILLGVFVLCIQAFIYNSNKSRALETVQADAVEDVRNQLNRAQNIIELLNKDATLLQVRTLVSSFGADAGHELMVLTDANDMVLASTSIKLIGKSAAFPDTAKDVAAIAAVKNSRGVEVFLSDDQRKVNGYASVCALADAGHLRMKNCGVMYLRNDITQAQNAIDGILIEDAVQEGIAIAVLGLILWMVIHYSLTRRAQRLIDTAHGFAEGNAQARAELDGKDELAVVGTAIDTMLDQIVFDRNALQSSEDRLRTVFESVADGILVYDDKGFVRAYNTACEDIFVRPRASVIGKPLLHLISPPGHRAFHNGLPHDGLIETIGLRPDGSEFDMEMSLSEMPLKGEHQTIAIVRDVTERKRVESLKSEFISVVSHELRTPITSIQGALGLILGGVTGSVPKNVRDMIDMCKRNSDRLLALINDILDMDKISSGNMAFNFEPSTAQGILDDAVGLNASYAEAHQVSFRSQCTTDAKVLIDADRIQQVLSNLLSNASKFSEPGDVIILSAEQTGSVIRFAVTDTGPGIPDHYADKIFDRFTQVEEANTRKVAGTGLGLSISKSIVERHHGTIGVNSELGLGSTFWFELPVCESLSQTPPGTPPRQAVG